MYHDNVLIIDNDGLHKAKTICANTIARSGVMMVTIEYFEVSSEAALSLKWKPPGATTMTVIPPYSWIPKKNVRIVYYDIRLENSNLIPFKSEMIETVNFMNAYTNFAGSGLEDEVAVLIVGYLHFRHECEYSICLTSDDGSKLFIDDVLTIDNDGPHAIVTICEDVLIVKETIKKMTIEYFELRGGAALILEWVEPKKDEAVVVPHTAWIPESKV